MVRLLFQFYFSTQVFSKFSVIGINEFLKRKTFILKIKYILLGT